MNNIYKNQAYYVDAYKYAKSMIVETDLEIRSALKQAATDKIPSIKDGEELKDFIEWAEKRMGL